MFGYRTEARLWAQVRERWEAQKTWPFFTDDDRQAIDVPEDTFGLFRMHQGITVSPPADKPAGEADRLG